MGKIDFDRINADCLAQYPGLLQTWIPGGDVVGYEYKARNPTRGDNKAGSFSINIHSGKWGDFATGDSGGDPISLYAYLHGVGQADAAKELGDQAGTAPAPRAHAPKPAKNDPPAWVTVTPVPADAPEAPTRHHRHGTPSRVWTYKDAEGRALGLVCRYDLPDGSKEVLPLTFCRSAEGGAKWRWRGFDKPRPMYGLDRLAARPAENVIIVEGEKCADELQRVLPDVVVVSWPGGSKATKHVDFSPLAGRKVVFWPDFDAKTYPDRHDLAGQIMPFDEQPGAKGMLDILDAVGDLVAGARIVGYQPGQVVDGWDCADMIAEGADAGQVLAFVHNNLVDPGAQQDDAPPLPEEPPEEQERQPDPERAEAPDTMDSAEETGFAAVDLDAEGLPFLCLGYDHGVYYYLPKGTRQVVELKADQHGRSSLVALAPLTWWERNFPGRKGPAWAIAADTMIRTSERRGVYDPGRIRGRGAWEDGGKPVLHQGSSLIVSGNRVGLTEHKSRYIYEAAAPLDQGASGDVLPASKAVHLVELCDLLSWERPISSKLLVGWCVVAPICGALNWRPHVWVTGPAGSGKSWVVDNILRPVIGPAALMVQSNTTEAGLRQELKHDARPVVFDEAEGEDRQAQKRIQNVLELMRQASTDSGAAILKGTVSGKAMSFRIRSAFAFSSIGVNLQQQADASRVTVLSLVRNQRPTASEEFEFIKSTWAKVLTPDFCAGLRARAVSLLPIIRKNATVFGRAAAEHLGSQRTGDQVGALLAGVFALYKSREASLDEAREWVAGQDWGAVVDTEDSADESRCLARILESPARVQGDKAAHDMTVGELVEIALADYYPGDVSPAHAEKAAARLGIKIDAEGVVISNKHTAIARMLDGTPWGLNWPRILARLQGATVTGKAVRFGAGSVARGVVIPVEYINNV